MTTIRVPRNAIRAATALAGLGLAGGLAVTGAAAASNPDNHGCVTTSHGYTFDCATGVLTWDTSVQPDARTDSARLYDRSTKPQTRVVERTLPHTKGGSVVLTDPSAVPCLYQWDVPDMKYQPGSDKRFQAGHQGERKPCQSTTTTQPTGESSTSSTTTTATTPATTAPTTRTTSTTSTTTTSPTTGRTTSTTTTVSASSATTSGTTSPGLTAGTTRATATGTTAPSAGSPAAAITAELPRTGGDLWLLAIGLAAVFAGTMLVLWTRRQS